MSHKEIKWSQRRVFFFATAVLISLTGTYLYFNVQRSDSDIQVHNLEQIDSLIISEKPTVQEVTGKNSRRWIEFKCIGYSKRFEINNYDYACVNDTEIVNNLKIGDLIFVTLLKTDVPDIRTETFNSKSNNIHSLICNGKEYLDLDCRNRAKREDNKFGYYLCFIMAPFTLAASLFKNKPKLFGLSFDPTLIICLIGLLAILILKNDIFK